MKLSEIFSYFFYRHVALPLFFVVTVRKTGKACRPGEDPPPPPVFSVRRPRSAPPSPHEQIPRYFCQTIRWLWPETLHLRPRKGTGWACSQQHAPQTRHPSREFSQSPAALPPPKAPADVR